MQDPFCPFCSREWQTLSKEVIPWLKAERAGAVDFTMYLLPQPWHPQSGMLCEAVIAAQEQSDKAAVDFLTAVWDPATRSQWGDDVTYTMSRSDIYDAMGAKIVAGQFFGASGSARAFLSQRASIWPHAVTESGTCSPPPPSPSLLSHRNGRH